MRFSLNRKKFFHHNNFTKYTQGRRYKKIVDKCPCYLPTPFCCNTLYGVRKENMTPTVRYNSISV